MIECRPSVSISLWLFPCHRVFAERPSPQLAMRRGSGRDDPEPAPSARAWARPAADLDMKGIDLVLAPVAVHGRTGGLGDHGSNSAAERSPGEPVHERVLQRLQRREALSGHSDQPFGIVSSRVRNRKEHGQIAARRVNDGGRERGHKLSQIRTDVEPLQRSGASFASGKSRFISA